jgi:hypothetical protein
MQGSAFTGQWIYRSVLNTPDIVGDFNKIKFGEGRLYLNEYAPGLITGNFDFGDDERLVVTGYVQGEHIRLRSTGVQGTATAGLDL